MSRRSQLVHNDPDCVMPTTSLRKLSHKIHSYPFPFPYGNLRPPIHISQIIIHLISSWVYRVLRLMSFIYYQGSYLTLQRLIYSLPLSRQYPILDTRLKGHIHSSNSHRLYSFLLRASATTFALPGW
ncbi:hypothetical protein Tco_1331423 [Tanacetum coccineum]